MSGTIPMLLQRNAVEFGDLPAITPVGTDETLTWAQLAAEVEEVAGGLASRGLGPGDRMLIMMPNRPEHWIADLAAVHLGAIPSTVYATLSSEQLGYLAEHSKAKVVLVEGEEQLERWRPVRDDVLTLDDWAGLHQRSDTFEASWRAVRPDQPVAVLYTSGTTGDPKGVVLSHRNVIAAGEMLMGLVDVPEHPPSLSYLPLAHIAERMLGIYLPIQRAGHVHVCPDITQVLGGLIATRPPSFFGVPRVWEKLVAGIRAQLAMAEPERRTAIERSMEVARRGYLLRADGKPVPDELAATIARAEEHVLKPLRAMLGLDNVLWPGSGAAPISYETLLFLAGLGIELLEVWGLTETTGAATANTPTDFAPGTVGRPVPGVELKLADDGEIFVRGPIVCMGYLRSDGEIEPATDAEGWLATGDVGVVDDAGYLTITDRKKELIITAGGENIAPTKIERLLRDHPLIGYAVAIGDRRPHPVALIVLDEEAAPMWAAQHSIDTTDLATLAEHPEVVTAVATAVDAANRHLSRVEQVKKHHILAEPWGPESPELTPKLSLRRRVIADRHAAVIDALYAPPPR